MNNAYAVRSPIFLTNRSFGSLFLREAPSSERKRALDFHVASGDYFGTLATVLGLISDSISMNDETGRRNAVKRLKDLRDELTYLQENHMIERKH